MTELSVFSACSYFTTNEEKVLFLDDFLAVYCSFHALCRFVNASTASYQAPASHCH